METDACDSICFLLTRNLYPRDEVEISLLLALLERKPVEECIFWTCELVYSGFDISQLLWSIYYDFYAQYNPALFRKIAIALSKLCGNGSGRSDIEPLLTVIKTLRVRKAADTVFCLRMSEVTDATRFTIYRGRVPKWLAQHPVERRPLLRAICNYDWCQVMFYINRRIDEPKKLIKAILQVMMEKQIINWKELGGVSGGASGGMDGMGVGEDVIDSIVENNWNNYGYEDEVHIMLALIVSLVTPDDKVDHSTRLIKLNENERKYFGELNFQACTCGTGDASMACESDANSRQIILKRHWSINEGVYAFDIIRKALGTGTGTGSHSNSSNFVSEIAENWVYHCCQTPYWERIFGLVCGDGYIDSEGVLQFKDDPDYAKLDAFARKYDFLYDLDEPFMSEMWKATIPPVSNPTVESVMDSIFRNGKLTNENEKCVELSNIHYSSEPHICDAVKYPGCGGSSGGGGGSGNGTGGSADVFDFTKLNKLLDTI